MGSKGGRGGGLGRIGDSGRGSERGSGEQSRDGEENNLREAHRGEEKGFEHRRKNESGSEVRSGRTVNEDPRSGSPSFYM